MTDVAPINGLTSVVLVALMCVSTAGTALATTYLSGNGQIPRMSRVGLYTQALVATDQAWRAGNRVAFRTLLPLVPLGAALIFTQVWAWERAWSWDVFTVVSAIWGAALVGFVGAAIFRANLTAKQVDTDDS